MPSIDPRIKVLLLPTAGFLGFFVKQTYGLLPLVLFAFLLYVYSHLWRKGFAYLVFFGCLIILEEGSTQLQHSTFVFAVYMVNYFLSRMALIAMFGNYMIKTTTISQMLEAFHTLKMPRSISIPFSVLLRFAPTMRHEWKALHENMRIRGVISGRMYPLLHPIKTIEYTLVPLMMRGMKIADELSASALIRGLDSDEKRITLVELQLRWIDRVVLCLGIVVGVTVVILQRT